MFDVHIETPVSRTVGDSAEISSKTLTPEITRVFFTGETFEKLETFIFTFTMMH